MDLRPFLLVARPQEGEGPGVGRPSGRRVVLASGQLPRLAPLDRDRPDRGAILVGVSVRLREHERDRAPVRRELGIGREGDRVQVLEL